MYNLEQLRMFVETADTGSFSACARKLGKVQSAISQGIANLELDLNIQLFDRSTGKPSLTAEGQRLYGYAKAILHQTHELNTAIKAIEQQEESRICLAVDQALLLPAFYEVIREFNSVFPATSLNIISLASQDVISHVADLRADLGMMFSDMSFRREVELGFIGSLPFYAVCSPAHPLSDLSLVQTADLIPHKQIMLRGQADNDDSLMPQISADLWWANDLQVILEMVKAGLGWTYLPCYLVQPLIDTDALHSLPLSFEYKPWSQPIDLIRAKNQPMGPAQSWLHEALKTILDKNTASV